MHSYTTCRGKEGERAEMEAVSLVGNPELVCVSAEGDDLCNVMETIVKTELYCNNDHIGHC